MFVFSTLDTLNIIRFSLPVCDVICSVQIRRTTTKRNMVDGKGDGEQDIYKPPFQSSVWKHFGFYKDRGVLNKLFADYVAK